MEYVSNHANVKYLDANQWKLADHLVIVLEPFEQATRECSSANESVSMVIPRVKILLMKLDKVKE